jgi:uncharacterized membrane protein
MSSALLYAASLRWLHILAGITWIGLLYYFNFVQAWAFPKMEAAARTNATLTIHVRALLWFRWAAMVTFLAGLALLLSYGNPGNIIPGYNSSPRGQLIVIGAIMGTIMMLNVWGIIWPNQKRIIDATQAAAGGAAAPPDQPKWARRAFLASRFNTMFSIPMVFFMVAAPFLGPLVR